MIKARNKFLIIALMLTLFCASAFLFSCGKNERSSLTATALGNGTVSKVRENGEEYFVATADDWHTFTGWYDGYRKYYDQPMLKITNNTPNGLEARFETTGVLTFDRILSSLYNSYCEAKTSQGENFNYQIQGEYGYLEDNIVKEKQTITLGGYVSWTNKASECFIKLKDSQKEDYKFIYRENDEDAAIYLSGDNQKYSYGDMGLFTKILKELPDAGESAWNCNKLVGNNAFYQFDRWFGVMNDYGIVESVENTENKSTLKLSIQKLLSTIKNYYPKIKEGSLLQKLTDILIDAYKTENFPRMTIDIVVNYDSQANEKIDSIEMKLKLDKDYKLSFQEKSVTIPSGEIAFNLKGFFMSFSNEANKVSDEEINSYPKHDKNMLNFSIEGKMDFVNESENKITDRYKVEIDADINPLALLAFKGEKRNYSDIDWNKLGFLSARAVLDLEGLSEDEKKETLLRHKSSTDYFNILIDTKKFGGKILVYAAFYDPATLLSTSYFFNCSYDIAELLNGNFIKNNSSKASSQENSNSSLISDFLIKFIDFCLNFDKNDVNKSIFDLINEIFAGSEDLANILSLQESGLSIELSTLREKIETSEIENNLIFLSKPFKTHKYLFGDEAINKIILNFERLKSNCVNKSAGVYIDKDGQSFIEKFNNSHTTVTEIKAINELDTLEINEILQLKDKIITADLLKLSDGSESENYLCNNSETEKMRLRVLDIRVIEKFGNKKAEIICQVETPYNKPNPGANFTEALNKVLGLPYGLYVFSLAL